jgi:hypothetical protein
VPCCSARQREPGSCSEAALHIGAILIHEPVLLWGALARGFYAYSLLLAQLCQLAERWHA